MSSIMTNTAAMTALKALQLTNNKIEMTQARISTGYEVGEASDNAAYWSIATTMRSDNKALGTVQDALGLGGAKVDVAYTALNSAIDVVDEIKSKLVAAREPGVDRSKIQSEIGELQKPARLASRVLGFLLRRELAVGRFERCYLRRDEEVSSHPSRAQATERFRSPRSLSISRRSELFDGNDQSGILDSTFVPRRAPAR
jgi:flagellin